MADRSDWPFVGHPPYEKAEDEGRAHPIDALGDGEALFSVTYEVQFFAMSQEEADMLTERICHGIFGLADVDTITGPSTAKIIEDYRDA